MSDPFLGEIRMISFNFAPRGWALCNGQLLPINQNQALFALLGTTFGGNGQTNFALPDLRGRAPLHVGSGFVLGQKAGEENHTLTTAELPSHTHSAAGSTSGPAAGLLAQSTWATHTTAAYAGATNTSMNAASTAAAGGNQPHTNMPPFLTLNIVIALQGIFPSPN
jgi:microcystin-dependent protein